MNVEAPNFFQCSGAGGGMGIVKLSQAAQQADVGRGCTVNPAAG